VAKVQALQPYLLCLNSGTVQVFQPGTMCCASIVEACHA